MSQRRGAVAVAQGGMPEGVSAGLAPHGARKKLLPPAPGGTTDAVTSKMTST